MDQPRHHIYLIPGFFGFSDLGGITYFHHIREFLADYLAEVHEIDAVITAVSTLPTSSIRKRARELLLSVDRTAGDSDEPIHLIGHSTGGLDARLFVTPSASLDDPDLFPDSSQAPIDLARYAARVRSVVTIATPHYGTPMASFFSSLLGAKLLWILSLGTVYTLQFGRLPLSVLIALGGILSKLDDRVGLENNVLDQFYDKLLGDFDRERRDAVRRFIEMVRQDQSLVGQLSPGGIDLFNAATKNREGVRYGSVVTQARPPGIRAMADAGLDPYAQSSHLLYRGLYFLTGRSQGFPPMRPDQEQALREAFGEVPAIGASDGMVPTLSQVWGEVIHAAKSDHLDVCGHFKDSDHVPPHIDWLTTGTGFRRAEFERLWSDVGDFVAESADG